MKGIRVPGEYDGDKVSAECGLACREKSLAVQSEKDECDINTLVKRFGLTGEMPQFDRLPIREDFVPVMDFHSAMNQVIEAETAFMQLPAELRKRFDHDPGKFVDFCSDPKNKEEIGKLGLLKPPEVRVPVDVRVIDQPKAENPKA